MNPSETIDSIKTKWQENGLDELAAELNESLKFPGMASEIIGETGLFFKRVRKNNRPAYSMVEKEIKEYFKFYSRYISW
jgi:hypothetical protein